MHFILSNYGEKYFGYVFACIYSIQKTNLGAKISLLWQDMAEEKINVLKNFYKNVSFVKTDFNFSDDEALRMSSKNAVFDFAMKNLPLQNKEYMCLLDVDMVVLGDIQSYFAAGGGFDIGVTDDASRPTPLNAGLFLAKYSNATVTFFERWAGDTIRIFDDAQKLAVSMARPYSGIEQMSLWELVDYPSLQAAVVNNVAIGGQAIKIKKFPCRELNHIYNGEIDSNTKVVHYKGVWNDFLLKGIIPSPLNFSKYIIFGNIFMNALNELNAELGTNYRQEFFNIKLHELFYKNALNKYGLRYNIVRNIYKIKNWLSKRLQ